MYYFNRDARKLFEEWKQEAKVDTTISFRGEKKNGKMLLYIYTLRPGLFIGLHGALVEKYNSKLSNAIRESSIEIHFVEIDGYC